jgi:type I restriction enzyme S subunit
VGEVAKVFAGGAAPQGDEFFADDGPLFIRVSDIGARNWVTCLADSGSRLSQRALASNSLVMAKAGTVLLPKSGAAVSTNSRAILGMDAYIVSHLMALEPSQHVTSEWLFWALCQVDMTQYSDNDAYPSLRQAVVRSVEIPLPPLAEQRRIAPLLNEQMTSVETARAAVQAQLEAAKALPGAYLRQVLPQPGRPLPAGWRWVRLGDFIADSRNGFGRRPEGNEDGPIVLRLADVSKGFVDLSNPRRVWMSSEDASMFDLQTGDLLFIRVNGSSNLVGRCILVPSQHQGLVFNDHLIRVRLKGGLCPPYLRAVCDSPHARKHFMAAASTSAGQLTINRESLRSLELPLPPLIEQNDIASLVKEQMATLAKLRVALEEQAHYISALPAVLLRRAFKGEPRHV